MMLPAELTWLVGKEACALRQAAWRPQLGHLASSGGVGGQVKDREQRLQLQRALRLLGMVAMLNSFRDASTENAKHSLHIGRFLHVSPVRNRWQGPGVSTAKISN